MPVVPHPNRRHDSFTLVCFAARREAIGELSLLRGEFMFLTFLHFFFSTVERRPFAFSLPLARDPAIHSVIPVSPAGLNPARARCRAAGPLAADRETAMIGQYPATGFRRPPPFLAVRT